MDEDEDDEDVVKHATPPRLERGKVEGPGTGRVFVFLVLLLLLLASYAVLLLLLTSNALPALQWLARRLE